MARARIAAAVLAAACLIAAVHQAHAGAVFEIRETIAGLTDEDYKFLFNATQPFPGNGIIERAQGGAGAIFRTSAVPLAIFTLEPGTAVSVHIHPNAAETLYVLEGALTIHQFRGEDDLVARATTLKKGEAGYIGQGAIHTVENVAKGVTKFLQLFDHPQAGAVFVSQALAALPKPLINSAFSADVLTTQTGLGGIIKVRTAY